MKQIITDYRAFFLSSDNTDPKEICGTLDLMTVMHLQKFGNRMLSEAQQQSNQNRKFLSEMNSLQSSAIELDMIMIRKNLNRVGRHTAAVPQ